jgi:protein-S-isoprenylcysteine O-methyltransferase Ste14
MIQTILIIAGLILRGLSVWQLGDGFSLQLKKPKKLETKGIYRLMRHPSYLGSLMIISGLSLINGVFGVLAISMSFFLERITDEEQIIDAPDYDEYKKKTGIFWPNFWR